jgi:organic hydroperoxide reductase OsmC/OhrA
LLMDEPLPLGEGTGPNASQVLSAAIGNCLSASALYCFRKAHIPVRGMQTQVVTKLGRNPQGRVRIAGLTVDIQLEVAEEHRSRMSRCMELFEDFCIVTESVRKGIHAALLLPLFSQRRVSCAGAYPREHDKRPRPFRNARRDESDGRKTGFREMKERGPASLPACRTHGRPGG